MNPIVDAFAPDGPLARAWPGFSPRAGQTAMALDIATAIEAQEVLCAEAGTGVGKTFAYLLPVLADGRRAIIATHTRSLQDQIVFGDLPRLQQALGTQVDVALLKGRANYYCHYRADKAAPSRRGDGALLAGLRHWAASHSSGDLDQYDGLPADSPLKPLVTSTAENCIGQDCPFVEQCCVLRARQRAARAQIVIANHHLLAADLALKDQGFGDLLARAATVVVDEAHKWADVLGMFFGFSISSYQLRDLLSDIQKLDSGWPALESAMLELMELAQSVQQVIPTQPDKIGRDEWLKDAAVRQRFGQWCDALVATAELAVDGAAGTEQTAVAQRLQLASTQAAQWTSAADAQAICWVQRGQRGFSLQALPLDVAPLSQDGFAAQQASWIFVSATLTVGGSFAFLQQRLGLADARCERYPSPFDYARQGRLFVPSAMGEPGYGKDHTRNVLRAAWPLLEAADGGAFILCTSRRAVQEAADLLREHGRWRVLQQGDEANALLLERFRRDGHAVLVGSASFWEGVDVPGAALRLVVIDRLPFASRQDPVMAARRTLAKERGESEFMQVDLPPAAVALQQAVGRLLRTETDAGVVMLADTRLLTKGYGRTLRDSLPPLPLITITADAVDFLARIRPTPAECQDLQPVA